MEQNQSNEYLKERFLSTFSELKRFNSEINESIERDRQIDALLLSHVSSGKPESSPEFINLVSDAYKLRLRMNQLSQSLIPIFSVFRELDATMSALKIEVEISEEDKGLVSSLRAGSLPVMFVVVKDQIVPVDNPMYETYTKKWEIESRDQRTISEFYAHYKKTDK